MIKDDKLSIRISKADAMKIRENAKKAKLSQSDYITKVALGKQVVIIEGIQDLLKEQRAIGNNLNQIAKLVNMGRITAINLDATLKKSANISEQIKEILERGRWKS